MMMTCWTQRSVVLGLESCTIYWFFRSNVGRHPRAHRSACFVPASRPLSRPASVTHRLHNCFFILYFSSYNDKRMYHGAQVVQDESQFYCCFGRCHALVWDLFFTRFLKDIVYKTKISLEYKTKSAVSELLNFDKKKVAYRLLSSRICTILSEQ